MGSGQDLEAAQLVKISKKAAVLADLSTVRSQLFEAKSVFCPTPPSPREQVVETNTRRRVRKPQQQKQPSVTAMSPLPQAGRGPMPINPTLALAVSSENSASRIAALAPPTTTVLNPRVRVAEATSTSNGFRE